MNYYTIRNKKVKLIYIKSKLKSKYFEDGGLEYYTLVNNLWLVYYLKMVYNIKLHGKIKSKNGAVFNYFH